MRHSTAIIVFARAPQLGRVKTRLIPALGEQGALDLYRAMLRHALHIAQQCAPDELILACAPDAHHPELQWMARAVGANAQDQRGADLGARMHHALCTALRRHHIALLIGSDCPSLCRDDLLAARAQLVFEGGVSGPPRTGRPTSPPTEMVFVPATDGGYVLVGATRPCAEIFREMPWGGREVMKMTRERLRREARKWHELQARSDIDRPEDLRTLPKNFRIGTSCAPKF